MSKQGAVLQKYNNELVKYIEELWSSRHILSQALEKDESDRQHLEKRLQQMHQELDVVVGRIRERTAERRQIDEMLREAEEAFSKVLLLGG